MPTQVVYSQNLCSLLLGRGNSFGAIKCLLYGGKVMTETLIAAAAGVTGAAVGGAFSYLSAKAGIDWGKARRDIVVLADQVAAYYRLEKLYAEKVAELTGGKSVTIQISMRDQVVANGATRPDMTENQAVSIRGRWVLP